MMHAVTKPSTLQGLHQ